MAGGTQNMSNKEDFREKIEAHRQTIEEEQNTVPSRMSRVNRNPKNKSQKKKKERNPLITILFIIFILIPLAVLFYVQFVYEPSVEKEVVEADTKNTVVEVEQNDVTEKTDKVEKKSNTAVEDDATADKEAVEQAQKDAEALKEKEANSNDPKTHVVQSNETLYRIAMNFYGDPSGVQKIMDANNLSSETISVGQTLIIPE